MRLAFTLMPSAEPLHTFMQQHAAHCIDMVDGLPSDGTPNLHRSANDMSRSLRGTLHSEAYQGRLVAAWTVLCSWFRVAFPGYQIEDILVHTQCACIVLCAYIQHLHNSKEKITMATETLLSVQWRFTSLKGALTEPWDLILSWKKELPLKMRTPLPLPLVEALFRWAMA